ncbi:MAG: 3-dehydroquinate synthase [Clostridia bacterium]|nr:3-dehydroquinate synthase [Clostridia bacterium]
MQDITVKTATVQSVIHCGAGAFESYAHRLKERQLFIVTDSTVNKLYSHLLNSVFGESTPKFVIAAGEKSKNTRNLLAILQKMLESGMHRNCCVVAFGGGVVGDIAGLAAALYMRGVHLVQIPTTLLAQVDSSVGGKTAVDMDGVKNVIGTFYQPEEVIADPRFLSTLPKREIRCGLGEIIKHGLLNAEIFKKLKENEKRLTNLEFLEEVVYSNIAHKAKVVTEDEKETNGLRKTLNLGHTTGHALELLYGKLSHGEYVLIGTYYELQIARKYGICGGQYAKDVEKLICKVLKKVPSFDGIERAADLAVHDKKNDSELISVIVPKCEGECAEIKLNKEDYKQYLRQISDNLRG